MTEKELTEAEVMQSANNLKKWCEEQCAVGTCDCPFSEGQVCRFYDAPQNWVLAKSEPRISDFEYEFLKRMDSKFKYIGRDKGGGLCAFESSPVKHEVSGLWCDGDCYMQFVDIRDILTFITWEDQEPISVQELMKEYEEYHA